MLRIPDLPPNYLDEILYRVPITKIAQKEALRTHNKGKKSTYSIAEYNYLFQYIFESIDIILTNVLGSYETTHQKFLPIPDKLIKLYYELWSIFHDLGDDIIFIRVQKVNFNTFKTLNGDSIRMRTDWNKEKGTFDDYKAGLQKHAHINSIQPIEIPFLLKNKIDQAINISNKYKEAVIETRAEQINYNNNIFQCNEFILNLKMATIKFKEKRFDIATSDQSIQFLICLLKAKRMVVEYITIAKELKLIRDNETLDNKDIAKQVQYIKRDSVNFLKNTIHMTSKEINSFIITEPKKGYKIPCG